MVRRDRHVGVEVDPGQALDIQHHVPVQHLIHRHDRTTRTTYRNPLLIAMIRSPAPMRLRTMQLDGQRQSLTGYCNGTTAVA